MQMHLEMLAVTEWQDTTSPWYNFANMCHGMTSTDVLGSATTAGIHSGFFFGKQY
jgi:hypothetical protein